jgi:Uma2 family endonuclease
MKDITDISQLDLNGTYSYADYLTWKFEQAVELIKGRILPMAAPSRRHQRISWQLTLLVGNTFKNKQCRAFAAPFDVRLFDKTKSVKANKDVYTVVQPDMCIICDLSKLDDNGCQGAPDMVIEILSPGNSKKEMRIKKSLYEENQIQEYWIVDPERETIHQFVLNEQNLYDAPTYYVSGEIAQCAIFNELLVPLDEVFVD